MSHIKIPKWINLIEEHISKKHIKCYEYNNFSNLKVIGTGGFGKVYRANWKSSHSTLALKPFNDATADKIVYEKYILVMEYADGGTLREYLNNNFDNLTWNDKLKMAHQLTCAVSYLHDKNIIHLNLHSQNVLIRQNTIKLTGFGLSDISCQNGIIPYIDPKKFSLGNYTLNKKSDVYSIGVLLWEMLSGRPPFEYEDQYNLRTLISQGLRETPIPNTPKNYEMIYTGKL
ncbi:kinase-like protein [Rhizophagus irregularis]|nr:kinase-like protein [Rhizophagus irregularis]